MTKIIQNISEVKDQYQAFFCDVWGVVHNGETANMPAVEALMSLRAAGKYVALVTNAPKTPSAIQAQLRAKNIPDTAYDIIITAGLAVQYSLFSSSFRAPYFIGTQSDRIILTDLPEGVSNEMVETNIQNADCVLCAGLDDGVKDSVEDYEIELRQALNHKLPMYCANPDIVVDRGESRILCAGALAKAYEELGGTVYQFGKPFPPIYQLAMNRAGEAFKGRLSPSDILFIGDGVETDLKGAMQEDIDALFVSGGLAHIETGTDRDGFAPSPEATKLESYLNAHGCNPRFTIGTLR